MKDFTGMSDKQWKFRYHELNGGDYKSILRKWDKLRWTDLGGKRYKSRNIHILIQKIIELENRIKELEFESKEI